MINACWSQDGKLIAAAMRLGEAGGAHSVVKLFDTEGKELRTIDLPDPRLDMRMVVDWR